MRVDLTRDAARDLDEIRSFSTREWGRRRTQAYMGELRLQIRALARDHARGRRRTEFEPEALSVSSGRHIIFYEVLDERVVVIRVLQDRMDFARHLAGRHGP